MLCFVMIMLVPIPVLFYADSVQQGRYHKLHQALVYIAVINFTVCTILHVTGIADYIETLPISQIILGVTFVSTFITFYKCMKQGTIRSDRLTLIGLSAVMISAIVEGLSVYFVVSISGMFTGIGMIILLFIAVLRTIRNVHNMEVQRQQRALEKRRQQTERLSLQMMRTLALTVEAKDEYTRGHSHRVAEYAALIAKELHWSPKEILNLKYAAHLHDIGKVGIPDTILNKPTRLTPEEYAVTKEHTVIGGEILKNITLLKQSADVARHHHERYDGKGYPDGLKGTDIPLYARIITIADSYDVMNTNHACRNSLPEASIIREFRENSGTQFDPELTEIFLTLLEEHRLDISSDYLHPENDLGFTAIENDINRFISNVMTTMKTHEDSETYDFLTGLPMRSRGEKLVSQFMQKYDGCLVFIDMDNLKQINDTHGHKAGDRSLKLLGTLLSDMTPDAVVCRLGGDEFLFFMPNATEATITAQVHTLFDKFNAAKAKDIQIRSASLSAGLCMTTTKDAYEDCYTKADKALYYVKQNGKGNLYFYHQLEQKLTSDSAINKDLTLIARSLRSSGDYSGALDLDYRQFAKLYEYINRLGSRHQYPCYLVMVTMKTAPEQMTYIENIEEAMECMKHSIHQSIRSVDICTRYSSMQYLIILFKPDENYIPKILNRIFAEYYKLYKKHNFMPGYEYLRIMDKPTTDETRQR
ncbi:HD domain-containing phosphohydrolase [Dorea sp. AM58-8]|uniref:HD domain-containing phosphohydrolase n=1 Tax=Dorea sp. AM58-8 TaxID=2292346 RepID=UPI001FA8B7DD|nr:HD domain-containing phosphohydrolase [Dorea sp. AM58-8]